MALVWVVLLVASMLAVFRGIDVICTRWNKVGHDAWLARLTEAEAVEDRAFRAWANATGPDRFDLMDAANEAAADVRVVEGNEPRS